MIGRIFLAVWTLFCFLCFCLDVLTIWQAFVCVMFFILCVLLCDIRDSFLTSRKNKYRLTDCIF